MRNEDLKLALAEKLIETVKLIFSDTPNTMMSESLKSGLRAGAAMLREDMARIIADERKKKQEEMADKSADAATYEKFIERDWSAVTVPELLQHLDKAKGKINPYNDTAKKLERLRRAIDKAFI